MQADSIIERVCPEQIHPLKFLGLLRWINGRPLLDVMEPYRQQILSVALYSFRPDGSPQYKRVLTGRAKKNSKTADAVFVALYRLLAWQPAGSKGNQVFFVASDLAQANDALDLCKKIVACNPVLANEVTIYRNTITRRDGQGFIEILASGDAPGLHGKTYSCYVHSELHTQKDYRVLEALELDRTRPDALQWFESYAPVSPTPGIPLNDILKQHAAQSDPRLYVSWYSGTIEEANPSLNGPLGPTMEDILDAQRALPTWIFRRLYQNLPGQPDGAAFDAGKVEEAIVKNRTVLPPQSGRSYVAFCDLSGGGDDDATLGIGHDEGGVSVLDCLVDQGARIHRTFSPADSVKKFADVLTQYGLSRVTGDRYAAQWPVEAFATHGITYRPAELNRSQIYSNFEPLLNSGRVALLDHPKLLQQFIGLIRRGEKIDHGSGEHDDHCNSAAGCLVLAAQHASQAPFMFFSGGRVLSSVSDAVSSVVQAISATAKAVTPTNGTPVRSIKELLQENLYDADLTDEEKARLADHAAHMAQQQQRQNARTVEALRRMGGAWFPSDPIPLSGWDDVLNDIHSKFQRWR